MARTANTAALLLAFAAVAALFAVGAADGPAFVPGMMRDGSCVCPTSPTPTPTRTAAPTPKPTDTPTPTPTPTEEPPPATHFGAFEATVFALLNAARAERGTAELTRVSSIDEGALEWSCSFVGGTSMKHSDLGKTHVNAENLAWGPISSPQQLHDLWASSAPHQANRQNPAYKTYGLGVCADEHGRKFVTERFKL